MSVRNFRWYLGGVGAWFGAYAMLMVLFPWLVAIELHETPQRVGIAQMALMLPSLLVVLFAGMAADRHGPRRVIMLALGFGLAPPLLLAVLLGTGEVSYYALLFFAVAVGTVQSFVTPAREGLLPQVMVGSIQRTVTAVTGAMFGLQIVGFLLAGLADHAGAVPLLVLNAAIVGFALLSFARLELPPWETPPRGDGGLLGSFLQSYGRVLALRELRPVILVNLAVGLTFMGAFMVGIPLLIRELHAGTPAQIAIANVANMAGVTVSIGILLKSGGIRRTGRALILALVAGAVTIAALALPVPFWAMVATVFVWGLGGGVAITMGRTLVQEMAPDGYRSRVMAVYMLAFMGGAPIGSLAMGYCVDWFGPLRAMLVPGIGMGALCLGIALFTDLWRLAPTQLAPPPKEATA